MSSSVTTRLKRALTKAEPARLRGATSAATTRVDDGRLHSDLWLDQPDAHDAIDKRRLAKNDADLLHRFVERGSAQFSIDLDEKFAAAFDADVEHMWERRPPDLSVSPKDGHPTCFAQYDGPVRAIGYRIPDLHGHSARALQLYLHKEIFRYIQLIFGQPSIAFQSLYFEYGSEQGLHRDPMFVPTNPASHIAACWIALEDIETDAGPLAYAPGTHMLPWIEFEPGSVAKPGSVTPQQQADWLKFRDDVEKKYGVESFTCKRGDVFIWHGGLMHGGMPVHNPQRTRKSFVVHYSTLATYKQRTTSQFVRNGDEWTRRRATTDVIMQRGNRYGLDAPLRGQF